MGEPSSDLTVGEIARTLVRLEQGQQTLLARLELMRGEFVHRSEWDERKDTVNRALKAVEDRATRIEENSKGLPWPMIATAVCAIAALAASFLR